MNHFVETYDPTIEDSYRKQVVLDGQPATLEVLDTAGQEEYTALRDQWIREGEGFLLVYSITSRSSFSRIRSFYNQIQRVKEDDDPFSVVIVGNKSDRGSEEREVSTQEGEALAEELGGVPFFESSAKLNIHIEAAFFECARQCKQLRASPPPGDANAASNPNSLQQQHQDLSYNQAYNSQPSQFNNNINTATAAGLQGNGANIKSVDQTSSRANVSPAQAGKAGSAVPQDHSRHSSSQATSPSKASKKKNKKDKCTIM